MSGSSGGVTEGDGGPIAGGEGGEVNNVLELRAAQHVRYSRTAVSPLRSRYTPGEGERANAETKCAPLPVCATPVPGPAGHPAIALVSEAPCPSSASTPLAFRRWIRRSCCATCKARAYNALRAMGSYHFAFVLFWRSGPFYSDSD